MLSFISRLNPVLTPTIGVLTRQFGRKFSTDKLSQAVRECNWKDVRTHIQSGMPIKAKAIESSYNFMPKELALEFLRHGDFTGSAINPLTFCVRYRLYHDMEDLLNNGKNPNDANTDGTFPLWHAQFDAMAAHLLLEYGAELTHAYVFDRFLPFYKIYSQKLTCEERNAQLLAFLASQGTLPLGFESLNPLRDRLQQMTRVASDRSCISLKLP